MLTQNSEHQVQDEEYGSRIAEDIVHDGSVGRNRAFSTIMDGQEDGMTGQLSNATSVVMKDVSERSNGDAVEAVKNIRELFVEEMGGLKTAMDEIKQMIANMYAPNEKAYADAKKPNRIEDMDAVMDAKLPGSKKLFQKAGLCPVLFSQITRYVVTLFKSNPLDIALTKKLSKVVTFSTREGKAVFESEVGRAVKKLRRNVVTACISNAQTDLFKIFDDPACANAEGSSIPKWLTDRTLCDMSEECIEIGCMRHEQKSDRTYARRL